MRIPSNLYSIVSLLLCLTLAFGNTLIHSETSPSIPAFEQLKSAIIFAPSCEEDIIHLLKNNHGFKKISIAGSQQSCGNQTVAQDSLMIDTKNLNKVLYVDSIKKEVRVQAGITWDVLEQELNKYGLSVKTRQSYANFSIGGSIGVNIHGQNIHETMLYDTIVNLKIILADGTALQASRTEHPDLFNAVIGGYGLLGVITEVTLSVTNNVILEKKCIRMKTSDYATFFNAHVKNNNSIHFHAARLSVDPDNLFNELLAITYYEHHNPTITDTLLELIPLKKAMFDRLCIQAIRGSAFAKKIRMPLEKNFFEKTSYVSRNNALRYSTQALRPFASATRDCLQEYFIPLHNFSKFVEELKALIQQHHINLLNISIRFVKGHTNPVLSCAPEDCFAFVIYFNLHDNPAGQQNIKAWTQSVIDLALSLRGKFYLPYEQLATQQQIYRAYPELESFMNIKQNYDPHALFSNSLYEQSLNKTHKY